MHKRSPETKSESAHDVPPVSKTAKEHPKKEEIKKRALDVLRRYKEYKEKHPQYREKIAPGFTKELGRFANVDYEEKMKIIGKLEKILNAYRSEIEKGSKKEMDEEVPRSRYEQTHAELLGKLSRKEKEIYKRFEQQVRTKDSYYAFEEKYFDPYQPHRNITVSKELYKLFRLHGKKLAGITHVEQDLWDRHRVEIETDDFSTTGESERYDVIMVPMKSLVKTMSDLRGCIDKYPLEFIKNSKLKTIYLVSHIEGRYKKEGISVGGAAFGNGKIVVKTPEWIFDHELLHQADSEGGALIKHDELWAKAAHGPKYKEEYGAGNGIEASYQRRIIGRRAERYPGFVSWYAREGGINEDQADTAAFLFRNPESYKMVMSWARKEESAGYPALAIKVRLIKRFYYLFSEKRMDDQFWEDFEAGKRIDQPYWAQRAKE